MRGGSQALLVRAVDENVYVAKCVGNPQGTRTLINEWIITGLLKLLQVSTPKVRRLEIKRGIAGDHLLEFEIGNRKIPVSEGVHLGSQCPVDPAHVAIFDFLPRHLLSKIVNLSDLTLAYVFDRWVSQADSRQAIFVRERSADPAVGFRAYLIDHGLSFGGSRWELSDTDLQGLYHDRSIYSGPNVQDDSHAAVDRIERLPEDALFLADRDVPAEWFANGDREQVIRLMELLSNRRVTLHDSVARALRQLRLPGNPISRVSERGLLLTILLMLSFFPQFFRTRAVAVDVELSAYRDADFSEAPRNKPLHLVAAAYDLTGHSLIAEVVNAYGVRFWQGEASIHDDRIEAASPGITLPGVYFFRIYARSENGARGEPLREYVLLIKGQ